MNLGAMFFKLFQQFDKTKRGVPIKPPLFQMFQIIKVVSP